MMNLRAGKKEKVEMKIFHKNVLALKRPILQVAALGGTLGEFCPRGWGTVGSRFGAREFGGGGGWVKTIWI